MNKYGGTNDMPKGWASKNKRVYQLWFDMLRRCYDEEQLSRSRGRSYANCVVCEEWKFLSAFAKDITKLAGYEQWVATEGMVLDKDILCGATKEYNKHNCCFVPSSVNIAVMNKQNPDNIYNAIECSKTKYLLEKDGVSLTFNSEKEACAFLSVKQCSVAGAWRDKGTCKGYKVTRIGNGADMRGNKDDSRKEN